MRKVGKFPLSFPRLFVSINLNRAQIMWNYFYRALFASPEPIESLSRIFPAAVSAGLAALMLFGCSAGEAPLSIHMYHPKTHQAFTCSARDQRAGADVSLLARAVESCAKTFEARGFIREN